MAAVPTFQQERQFLLFTCGHGIPAKNVAVSSVRYAHEGLGQLAYWIESESKMETPSPWRIDAISENFNEATEK